jgi:hypothetical protein
MPCISGGEKYANLYLTRLRNGQPLYVFECCHPVADEAYDTTDRYPPLLDTSYIVKKNQDSVVIFVPPNFIISANAKYVIAPVDFMMES